jgi:ribosome biogenesis protein Tsr3
MTTQDLEIAKERLSEKKLALCIVKNGKIILETGSRGVSGFLDAIERFGDRLVGASVADRVAGKAIALLCVYAKIKAIYAVILSSEAKSVFAKYEVHHEWKELVANILDAEKVGVCPFEKSVEKISSPKNAYKRLRLCKITVKQQNNR